MVRRFQHFLAIFAAVFILLAATAPTVEAASLESLRASGAIGERFDGYVVAREASAKSDAAAINGKRKQLYSQKASEEGVSVGQVGRVYASQIFKKLPAGSWFQKENGAWMQK